MHAFFNLTVFNIWSYSTEDTMQVHPRLNAIPRYLDLLFTPGRSSSWGSKKSRKNKKSSDSTAATDKDIDHY